jgi:hypothetical protein
MSDEQINIAIAGACGWAHPSVKPYAFPNYSNDLNAMHEAEETLDLQKAGVFAEQLRVTVYRTTRLPHVDSGSFAHVHATASQRAEAFLRTIGKWEGAE